MSFSSLRIMKLSEDNEAKVIVDMGKEHGCVGFFISTAWCL